MQGITANMPHMSFRLNGAWPAVHLGSINLSALHSALRSVGSTVLVALLGMYGCSVSVLGNDIGSRSGADGKAASSPEPAPAISAPWKTSLQPSADAGWETSIQSVPEAASSGLDIGASQSKPKGTSRGCGRSGVALFSGICASTGAFTMGFVSKDFAQKDIGVIGTRFFTPFVVGGGGGAPLAFYHLQDVARQTESLGYGGLVSTHILLKRQSEEMAFSAFLRLTVDGRSNYDESGNFSFDVDALDTDYYGDIVEEAWVQVNGIKIGVQQSAFGFNRTPSVLTPGYTSVVTTKAASITFRPGLNTSLTIAAEDPERRIRSDGVLSRSTATDMPDVIGLIRHATPSTLYHFSGAFHRAADSVVAEFAGGREKRVSGFAISAGAQTRVLWSDLFGPIARQIIGRASITAAYAEGALGYLGTPFFAPDYVVNSDGSVDRSSGWSAVASYDHMVTKNVKANLNYSYFSTSMNSSSNPIFPDLGGAIKQPGLEFETRIQGSVLQAGLEYIPRANLILGVEAGYTWTAAEGTYSGAPGANITAKFPHLGAYVQYRY